MKKLFLAFVGIFLLHSWCLGASLKIGVVDLQKAIVMSERGRRAKAELDKEFEEKKREIDKKKAELEALRNQLEKEAAILSEKAKKEKEKEYRKRLRELQGMIQEAKLDLMRKEQELTQKIINDLVQQIREFAKKNGYTLILEKRGGVIYCDPSLDLTNEMIRLYDAQFRKSSSGKTKKK